MSPTTSQIDGLIIRDMPATQSDREAGMAQRFLVTDTTIPQWGTGRIRVVGQAVVTGRLVCSCDRPDCRHVDGVRAVLESRRREPAMEVS